MKTKRVLTIISTLLFLAACQPADRGPVFNHAVLPSVTSIPMSSVPRRAAARLPGRIQSFDVSRDSKVIALATSAGVMLYDFSSQKHLRTLNETADIFSVAWSPDGSRLAAGSVLMAGSDMGTAHLVVWDTSTWKTVFEPDFGREMLNETFRDIAWSPDSRSLAVSTDVDGVIVFDMQTGNVISHQKGFAASVLDISWSLDGSRLVATGDLAYGIRRWKVSTDEAVRLFDRRVSNPMQVAWSPDGERLASGHAYGGVCFWTAATNRCDGYIRAHRTAVFSLAWSPDGGQLATGGGVIRIWDTHSGQLITAFGEENGAIYGRIEWPAADKPIVTLSTGLENPGNTVVQFWDIASGSVQAEIRGTMVGE